MKKKQKTGSYQSRFVLRVEAFRGGDGRCFRFPVLTVGGRVKGLGGKVLPGSIPFSFPSRTTEPPNRTRPLGGGDRGGGGGLEWKVFPGFDSCPGWKGLELGMESASGPRFLPRVGGSRVREG